MFWHNQLRKILKLTRPQIYFVFHSDIPQNDMDQSSKEQMTTPIHHPHPQSNIFDEVTTILEETNEAPLGKQVLYIIDITESDKLY